MVEEIMFEPCWRYVYTTFTPCLQTCLHHAWRHVYMLSEKLLKWYKETYLQHVRWHVYTQFEHMFTPCWKTCLHIVWNMFTQYSKTYLYRVERNSYSMLEDLILLGLIIMHLHNVWRQFSIIFENMLTHFLETFFLHHVRRYVMLCMKTFWHKISSTFEDVFIQCWQT